MSKPRGKKVTGVKSALRGIILGQRPGTRFTVKELQGKLPVNLVGCSPNTLSNSMTVLMTEGAPIVREARGHYLVTGNGAAVESTLILPTQPQDDEVIVIDNLLSAMAAAEPVLRKYKPIMNALRSLK